MKNLKKIRKITVSLFLMVFPALIFAITPNLSVSAGKKVYASYSFSAGDAQSLTSGNLAADWCVYYDVTNSNPVWIAINIGAGPTRVLFSWNCPACYGYNNTTYGCPATYDIQVSADSSNGTNGIWVTRVSVTNNNTYCPREHSIDFTGMKMIRMKIYDASTSCKTGWWGRIDFNLIDVLDISAGAPDQDTWFFMGDSIVAFWASRIIGDGPSYQQRISMSNQGMFYPGEVGGGFPGWTASGAISVITQCLNLNPDCKYWALCWGANDSAGNSMATNAYRNNMQLLINSVKSAGRTPIIPKVCYASDGGHNNVPLFNKIVDSLTAINNLPPGPNIYSWFSNHPDELSDGLHPNHQGMTNYNRLWAEAMLPLYRSGFTITNLVAMPSIITNNPPHIITFNLKVVPKTGMITNVSLNLMPLGGSGTVSMSNISGSTQFRFSYTVPAWIPPGNKTLPVLVKNNNGLVNGSKSFMVSVIQFQTGIVVTNVQAQPSIVSNNKNTTVVFTLKSKQTGAGSVTNVSLNLSSLAIPGWSQMSNISGFTSWRFSCIVPAGLSLGPYTMLIKAMDDLGYSDTNHQVALTVVNGSARENLPIYTDATNLIIATWTNNNPAASHHHLRQTNDGLAEEGALHYKYNFDLGGIYYDAYGLSISGWNTNKGLNLTGATQLQIAYMGPTTAGLTAQFGLAFYVNKGSGLVQQNGASISLPRTPGGNTYVVTNINMRLLTNGVGTPNALKNLMEIDLSFGGALNGTGTFWIDNIRARGVNKTNVGDLIPPTSPVLVSPASNSSSTNGSFHLVWRKSTDIGTGVAGYTVQVSSNGFLSVGRTVSMGAGVTNWTCAPPLSTGTWSWDVIARDGAGNINTSEVWTLAKVTIIPFSAPFLNSPANNSFVSTSTPNLQWRKGMSTNILTNYIVYLDGQVVKTNSWSVSNWNAAVLGQGVHAWRVKVVDKAGDTNTSGTWTFTVDTVPPDAPALKSPAANSYVATATPVLQWGTSTNNVTNYIVYVDGQVVKTNSWSASNLTLTTLGQGTHSWRVKAVDKSGNTNASGPWTFTVDSIPPSAPALKSPLKNSVVLTTIPVLQWGTSTNNVTNYIIYVDGHAVKTNSSSVSNWRATVLGQGTHTWMIKAVNKAGNSGVSLTWTFTVNTLFMDSAPGVFPTYYNLSKGKKANIYCGGSTGEVNVKIYDLAGYLVKDFGTRKGTDVFTWDGKADSGAFLQPAVYLIRFSGNGFDKTVKFMLVK